MEATVDALDGVEEAAVGGLCPDVARVEAPAFTNWGGMVDGKDKWEMRRLLLKPVTVRLYGVQGLLHVLFTID